MVSHFFFSFTLGMEFGILISFSFILLPEVDVEEVGNLQAVASVTCHSQSTYSTLPTRSDFAVFFLILSFSSPPPPGTVVNP